MKITKSRLREIIKEEVAMHNRDMQEKELDENSFTFNEEALEEAANVVTPSDFDKEIKLDQDTRKPQQEEKQPQIKKKAKPAWNDWDQWSDLAASQKEDQIIKPSTGAPVKPKK